MRGMINLGLCIKIKTAKRQHQDGTKPALWVREVGRLAEGPFPQEFQDLLRKKKHPSSVGKASSGGGGKGRRGHSMSPRLLHRRGKAL